MAYVLIASVAQAVKDVAAQLIATSSPADGDARSPADGETQSRATAPAEADWRGCLQLLAESNRPLIEALQVGVNGSVQEVDAALSCGCWLNAALQLRMPRIYVHCLFTLLQQVAVAEDCRRTMPIG